MTSGAEELTVGWETHHVRDNYRKAPPASCEGKMHDSGSLVWATGGAMNKAGNTEGQWAFGEGRGCVKSGRDMTHLGHVDSLKH